MPTATATKLPQFGPTGSEDVVSRIPRPKMRSGERGLCPLNTCTHDSCAYTHRDARRPCVVCAQPIGYDVVIVTRYSGEDFDPGVMSHQACDWVATRNATRVSFTAFAGPANPDLARDLVIEAVVLPEGDLADAVLFVSPDERELELFHGLNDSALDRLREDCACEVDHVRLREKVRRENTRALAGVMMGLEAR